MDFFKCFRHDTLNNTERLKHLTERDFKLSVCEAFSFSISAMTKYFIYCRKSSEEEERQMLSIEAQLTELREYAKQHGLFIIREFYESKTAKEPGREVFNDMLAEIEKGNASGILAWNLDRLARNSVDGGKVIYLVDTGKIESLKFPTFWFEATPQGKFMLSVAFGQAKYYTDNLRENVLRGLRQKIRRGEYPCKAPLGYFNEPRKRTVEPDRQTFRKVKEILQAFGTGQYGLTAIQRKAFSLGLVGRDGRKLHLASIRCVLTNPFYYGMFRYHGELHQGTHKPMISKKLFDTIQQALIQNGKPRLNMKDNGFQFMNFATCAECGYAITAERHIKASGLTFVYYHCTWKNKFKRCLNRTYVREERLASQVKALCQKVSLPDEWRDKFFMKLEEWKKEQNESGGVFAQNAKIELKSMQTKLQRLTEAYLAGALDLAEYQSTKNNMVSEKKTLEEKLEHFERKGNHWLELTRNWILEANQARNLARRENYSEISTFLKSIGLNRTLNNGEIQMNFKKPWNELADLEVSEPAAGGRAGGSSRWWTCPESNWRPHACEACALTN